MNCNLCGSDTGADITKESASIRGLCESRRFELLAKPRYKIMKKLSEYAASYIFVPVAYNLSVGSLR
jgi:hypothetical protein